MEEGTRHRVSHAQSGVARKRQRPQREWFRLAGAAVIARKLYPCWYAADGTRSSANQARFRGSLPPAPVPNGDGLDPRRSNPNFRHQWRRSSSLSHPSWRLSAATRVLRIDNHFLVMLGSRRTPVRRTTIPVAPALILGRGYWTYAVRSRQSPCVLEPAASRSSSARSRRGGALCRRQRDRGRHYCRRRRHSFRCAEDLIRP